MGYNSNALANTYHEDGLENAKILPQYNLLIGLFVLRLYIPVNNFSVMSGWSHRFLGITSTFWEVNVSCSRIRHSDLSEDRTQTSHSGVRRATTRPPRLPQYNLKQTVGNAMS